MTFYYTKRIKNRLNFFIRYLESIFFLYLCSIDKYRTFFSVNINVIKKIYTIKNTYKLFFLHYNRNK